MHICAHGHQTVVTETSKQPTIFDDKFLYCLTVLFIGTTSFILEGHAGERNQGYIHPYRCFLL